MSLIKIIRPGEMLVFDLTSMSKDAKQRISVTLTKRAGQQAVLEISADRSVPIRHFDTAGEERQYARLK